MDDRFHTYSPFLSPRRSRLKTQHSALRLGFFGGTFDPVHNAHLMLARAAVRELKLDRVYFIPAGRPPHKSSCILSPASTRLALLRAAVRPYSAFRVSSWETRRKCVSYTVKTLSTFRKRFPRAKWYLLIGGDSLQAFKTWKEWPRLLKMARLVVGRRAVVPLKGVPQAVMKNVTFLKMRLPDISATRVREGLEAGGRCSQFLSPVVRRLICQKGYYRKA